MLLTRATYSRRLEKIILKERPDALLPTLAGKLASIFRWFSTMRVSKKYSVEMIGAKPDAIKGEARDIFKQAMLKIGLDVAKSATVTTLVAALKLQTI